MSAPQVVQYLERIGIDRASPPSLKSLVELQRAHLQRVPFENLDICMGKRIELSLDRLFDKIVRRRRGGFCYELNGLFAWLLEELGYSLRRLAARVYGDGVWGPEFDHMLLLVDCGGQRLVDVGFGASFVEPMPFAADVHEEADASYRVVASSDAHALDGEELWVLERRERHEDGAEWLPQYAFALAARQLDEFAEACVYQQTSPDSNFTKKSICTRRSDSGRITVSNGRLIRRLDTQPRAQRSERAISDLVEFESLLRSEFGVAVPDAARCFDPFR